MYGKEGYRTKRSQHRRLQGKLKITAVKWQANDEMALALRPKVRVIATKKKKKAERFDGIVEMWTYDFLTVSEIMQSRKRSVNWYDGDEFVTFFRQLQSHSSSHNWGKYENSWFNSDASGYV